MRNVLFDTDYTGPRWTYGLTYRPLAMAAVPEGWIVGSLRDHPKFRFGTVDYPHQLPGREVFSYELELVNHSEGAAA